jgi:hypothetical protein
MVNSNACDDNRNSNKSGGRISCGGGSQFCSRRFAARRARGAIARDRTASPDTAPASAAARVQ